MNNRFRQAAFPLGVLLAACFGVFLLPFLLPPPAFQGVSAANSAGFNNKIASVVAAFLGVFVFAYSLLGKRAVGELRTSVFGKRLPVSLIVLVPAVVLAGMALVCFLICHLSLPYRDDTGYFVHQMTMHSVFGHKLYDQVELPYGPLLYYPPLWLQSLLSPLHLSLRASYFACLIIESVTGLLLLAYVINALPLSRFWRIGYFLLGAVGALPVNLGVNYTFFRFIPVFAFLVYVTEPTRTVRTAAVVCLVGQAVCFGISPEMGFAFFVSITAYAVYRAYQGGLAWLTLLLSSLCSCGIFFLAVGSSYLKLFKLFARGLLNIPVEPVPICLIFLGALIWIAPRALARSWLNRNADSPRLTTLYVASLALLPAALGRADPWHIFWNGFIVLLLAGVGVCAMPMRYQAAWAAALCLLVGWTVVINGRFYRGEIKPVIHIGLHRLRQGRRGLQRPLTKKELDDCGDDGTFDLSKLQTIVGHDRVATPFGLPLAPEAALMNSGQFTPSYFSARSAILDGSTEEADVKEFNTSKWALIPEGSAFATKETPEELRNVLGLQLPYRSIRKPYVAGGRFADNISHHWELVGRVGNYKVYEHK